MHKKMYDVNATNPAFFGASFRRLSPDDRVFVFANNVHISDHGYESVRAPTFFTGSPNISHATLDNTANRGLIFRGMFTLRRPSGLKQVYLRYGSSTGENVVVWSGGVTLQNIAPATALTRTRESDTTVGAASIASWAPGLGTDVFCADGINRPIHRTGSTAFKFLTGTTGNFSTAEIVRSLGAHMLFFRTSTRHTFHWSDQDNFESYTAESNNAAGNLTIYPLQGNIVAAEHLGNDIAVYSANQQFLVFYQGKPFYFGWRKGADEIGAWSKTSVVPVGNMHYGWGPGGVWRSDGLSAQYLDGADQGIGSKSIKEFIQYYLNIKHASKIHGFHDNQRDCVVWWFPCNFPQDFGKPANTSTTEPTVALVYHYARNCWTTFSFPGRSHHIVASNKQDVFDTPIYLDRVVTGFTSAGTASTEFVYIKAWAATAAQSSKNTPMVSTITSQWLDFGDAIVQKELFEARLNIQDVTGQFNLMIHGSQGDVSTGVVTSTIALTSTLVKGRINLSRSARLFRFQFQTTGTSGYSFNGMSFYGRAGGD